MASFRNRDLQKLYEKTTELVTIVRKFTGGPNEASQGKHG